MVDDYSRLSKLLVMDFTCNTVVSIKLRINNILRY